MKHLFACACVCALLVPALRTQTNNGTIRGNVTLKADNSPLHHATVLAVQLRRTVETVEDGSFEIRNVPPGRYELVAHMHALTDDRRTVDVRAGAVSEVRFSLGFAPVRQEITVTAAGHEETTLESFQTVTSLDGQQLIVRNTAPALGEMLDHEPGIAKRSYGPGSSRPVIRGFDGDRVLVLQDGVRTGTLSSQSGDHGEPVDGTSLERVEVVRGPATLLYGSNAIGGVVNVITRHHEMDQHPHVGIRGHLAGLAGSNNGLGGGSGGFELGKGNFLFWAMGGGQRTGDYKTSAGKVDNSGTRMTQTSAGLGRYGERSFFSFSYGVQDGKYGIPGGHVHAEEETPEEHEEEIQLDWRRHQTRFHGGFRNMQGWLEAFKATLNYTDWNHKELEGSAIGTQFFNKQFTWRGQFDQQKRGPWSGSFGVWGLYRDFEAVGEEALAPPVKQNAFAAFGVEQFTFERFRLQLGGRLEHNSYDPQDLESRSFTGASGSVGLFVPVWSNGAVVANYTTSYRAPALEELYNYGPHLGNLAFEIGNPDLSRERAHGVELSLRHAGERTKMEFTGYYNRIADFVYLAPTGETEEGLFVANYDQAAVRYLGAEARADLRLHPNVWLNLGFDVVDAQIRASKVPLPRIPPVRGRVGLDLRGGRFSVRPELVLSNQQHQLFPTETSTAGYAVINLVGTYTIATQHFSHLFGVNLFNAGDRLYRNHLSFIKEVAPEIGRGIRISYTMNFY